MLRKFKIKILKNKYKQLYKVKYKIKEIILKNIFFNRNITYKYRAYAFLILNNSKILNKKLHKICKFSGYRKNVNKITSIGRHQINRLATVGKLQNISVNSW